MPNPLRIVAVLILLAVCLARESAFGVDPQPYNVTLKPTGNSALDQALKDSSQLISLRENSPVGPFALVTRARQDAGRFQSALNSVGDYKGRVTITIAGRPLDDPGLLDLLEQAPADPPVEVVAEFDQGPQFHIGKVIIDGDAPAEAREKLDLAPGAPAVATDVLAAQQRLLTAIREAGYPLAKVDLPPVTLRAADNALDVTFRVAAGPHADIGPITITGLKTVNEDYVRRRLLLRQGQQFTPTQIEAARADLSATGVFSVVRIEPADQLDPDGTIPIAIDVTERPLHSVDVGAAYSTDLGINANAGWHHRNL
ncbi:MAG TPA: POTRA domain-containing protein, partial [Acetobacteraceae bacterium]